jgi:hypothetical protein
MADQEPIKTQLRLSPELHQRMTAAAKQSGRSMNAEIVHRLEGSLGATLASEPGTPRAVMLLAAIAEQAETLRALGRELGKLDEKEIAAGFVERGAPASKRRARQV